MIYLSFIPSLSKFSLSAYNNSLPKGRLDYVKTLNFTKRTREIYEEENGSVTEDEWIDIRIDSILSEIEYCLKNKKIDLVIFEYQSNCHLKILQSRAIELINEYKIPYKTYKKKEWRHYLFKNEGIPLPKRKMTVTDIFSVVNQKIGVFADRINTSETISLGILLSHCKKHEINLKEVGI